MSEEFVEHIKSFSLEELTKTDQKSRMAANRSPVIMQTCPSCGHAEPEISHFCTRCGTALREGSAPLRPTQADQRVKEELNLPILYLMVAALILALIVPPWETPPSQPPAFLGFHFVLDAPPAGTEPGVISRLLLTIEVVTLAVAGLYFSWLFRKKAGG